MRVRDEERLLLLVTLGAAARLHVVRAVNVAGPVAQLRAVDRLAVYGQNVVELILPQADEAEAIATARRLIDACAARVELACGAALLPN